MAVVSAILLNSLAGSISDSALAAVGVCTKIMMFPFGIVLGFATGFQPVAGFNWGAKRYDRVEESYNFASKTAAAGSILLGLVLLLCGNRIIAVFASDDEQMHLLGVITLASQCITLPVHAWVCIVNMLCAGLGNARYALILSTARQGTCFIAILYPLVMVFGAYGIAVVQGAADLLSLALAIPIMIRVKRQIKAGH